MRRQRTARSRRGSLATTLLAVVWLGSAGTAGAGSGEGQLLYLQQCAPCHGVSGRGDGPDATVFAVRPRDLRDGFVAKYPTADLVNRILDGRRLELVVDLPALRARAADTEAVIAYMQRLPQIDWHRVEAGGVIYVNRCEACHGAFGHPTGSPPDGVRAPRDLSTPTFQESMSDHALVVAVRHGRSGMPALLPRLSEREAEDVAAYVRLLSPGFETYSQYCANCHGERGIGTGSFGESQPMPTVIFDRAYFARTDPEILRSKVWHMLGEHQPSMPHFAAVLTPAQARAIVDFLRTDMAPANGAPRTK